jgi:hypothetical protein
MTKSELIGTEINRDFVLGAWTRFIGEVALGRDVIDGTTREDNLTDTVGTRGLAMYFFPLYYRATLLAIDQLGHVPRNPAEWGGVSIAGFEAAKASYLREQGGGAPGPVVPIPPVDQPSHPPGPSPSERPAGSLQVEHGGAFHINGQPWLPCWWHDGSLFAVYCQDPPKAEANLDAGAEAGHDGERSWITLDGSWWEGLHVGPRQTTDYYGRIQRFGEAHKARGLHWFMSHGSMFPDSIPDGQLRDHFRLLGQVCRAIGPEWIDIIEWCNEVFGACPSDRRDPRLMNELMDIFRAECPEIIQAGSACGGMPIPVEDLNAWSRDIYLQHSFRGFRWPNKVEHAWSTPYEDKPKRRAGINSEPPARNIEDILRFQHGNRERGVNAVAEVGRRSRAGRFAASMAQADVERWVSAIENSGECDSDFQVALALACWITRQGFVLFSSPGVRPDPTERIDQIAGWREVPAARKSLPADVGRYQSIWHGGDGRSWSALRVFGALPGTRCEHTYHDPDGRFVVLAYGEAPGRVPQLRPARIDRDISFGNKARLIVGQAL